MEIKNKIQMIKGMSTYKLHIPYELEAKIRHLCSVISNIEWSGTLFYKTTGSFETNDLEIHCLDLYVMDVGNASSTEFNDSPDIVTYRALHPELLQAGVNEGLIHSHHTMSAFFSGTDTATLSEKGADKNHFLSLIVNNAGNYVARITRKIIRESNLKTYIESISNTYYNTFEDVKVVLSENEKKKDTRNDTKQSITIEYYDLEILKPEVTNDFEELDERINNLRSKPFTHPITHSFYNPIPNTYYNTMYEGREYPLFDHYKEKIETKESFSDPMDMLNYIDKYTEISAAKIISGCIITSKKAVNNVSSWIGALDAKYSDTFGDLKKESVRSSIREWLSTYIEYILFNLYEDEDTRYTALNPDIAIDEIVAERASSIYDTISDWRAYTTKSIIIDIILNILKEYSVYE